MKIIILSSLLAGGLLSTLAAQQSVTLRQQRWMRPPHQTGQALSPLPAAKSRLPVYVITVDFEFGAVDLGSGTFLPIGTGLPPDAGAGLVAGPGTSLLTLGFSGNLDAIDPRTGTTTVIGWTGLGPCLTPASPCGPTSANVIGYLDGHYYVTDFANNLYSLDVKTGKANLIGPTGMPAITFIPFAPNPDGTFYVYAESLVDYRGRLYALFSTARIDPKGSPTTVIPGEIYEINTSTGHATPMTPADSNLSALVNVSDTIYGFDAATGKVVTVDLATGQTKPVSETDPGTGVVVGATPARPAPASLKQ